MNHFLPRDLQPSLRSMVTDELDRLSALYGVTGEPLPRPQPLSPAYPPRVLYRRRDDCSRPRLAQWRPYTISAVELERIHDQLEFVAIERDFPQS